MAEEILTLHSGLCRHYDSQVEDSLSLKLTTLSRSEAEILIVQCSGSRTAETLHLLGLCHARGVGTTKDAIKAVELFRESAELANPLAMNDLAGCLFYGTGLPKDMKMAIYWWTRSADLGNSCGMRALAKSLRDGTGIEKDERKAVEWFRKAHALGDLHATSHLGFCYHFGKGVPKNLEKAIDYYRESDTATSFWNLGIIFQQTSPTTALQYFSRALDSYPPGNDREECRAKIIALMTEDLRVEILRRQTFHEREAETLRTETQALRTEVDTLRAELRYRPGCPGYAEALDDFGARARDLASGVGPSDVGPSGVGPSGVGLDA